MRGKGITLIALVITVIVLLILAGISISMLTGDNGILTNSSKAKIEKIHADVLEMMKLEAQSYYIEKETNGVNNTLTEYLQEKGILTEIENDCYEINVEVLLGSKKATGGGSSFQDVYLLQLAEPGEGDTSLVYSIIYYDESGADLELGTLKDNAEVGAPWDNSFAYLFRIDNGSICAKTSDGYYDWGRREGFFDKDGNEIHDLVIPNEVDGQTVTAIGDLALFSGTTIRSVAIPNSVTSIGNRAFEGCYNLTNITIPNSVTCICWRAFSDCISLTDITIPNGVTSIGGEAFEYCSSLASITIPRGVSSIGDNALGFCSNSTEIVVDEGNDWFCVDEGVLFNKDKTKLIYYPAGRDVAKYVIPSSVGELARGAFTERSIWVYIPKSVTTIPGHWGDDSPFWYSNCKLFCESKGRQSGWGSRWNEKSGAELPTQYNVTLEQFEALE